MSDDPRCDACRDVSAAYCDNCAVQVAEAAAPRLTPGRINKLSQDLQKWQDEVYTTRLRNQMTGVEREVFLMLETHLKCAETLAFYLGNDKERWG